MSAPIDLAEIYRDLHSHPELSLQETRTAGLVAQQLDQFGYQVEKGVGGTGVVGVLHNGGGATALLRADMDALPVKEQTGLPYASTARGTDRDGHDVALKIIMYGRGAHGSRPEVSIDPVVMAAATVMRLQTVVSREVPATETAVLTIGALRAGTKENIIPDDAELLLSIRTFEPSVLAKVMAAIERIVNAEAAAAGAPKPPEITHMQSLP
jgi:metal-dependent amidase/aminoacylase/carboxypeptidase family protein